MVERLQAEPAALAIEGALAHPEIPQQGIVPGLPAWEYYFHGRGCCLTHRTSGQSVDVDFHDATSDWIADYFFIRYLQSVRRPVQRGLSKRQSPADLFGRPANCPGVH